jgi:putative transposase
MRDYCSGAYIIKAAEEFKDKTTAPTQLSGSLSQDHGLGWYYLSTVLDDFSRFSVAWELCATMKARERRGFDSRHRRA